MAGDTAQIGSETAYAAGDHIHPHDSSKVDVVTYTSDKSTIEGNITGLDTRLTTAEGNISTNTGDITSLKSRVSDTEDGIESLKTRMGTVEGSISNLDTRLSGLVYVANITFDPSTRILTFIKSDGTSTDIDLNETTQQEPTNEPEPTEPEDVNEGPGTDQSGN